MAEKKHPATADEARVFLTARGDMLLELVKQLRENTARELKMLDTVLELVQQFDGNLEIPAESGKRLVGMLRHLKPKETAGLSDEEVIKKVGGVSNGS